jgi:phosphatidylserine/phosphatidylglycerophosphate/cardiolipin synthase-like enzyme
VSGLRLLSRGILSEFAALVYANQARAYKLWIVSPWLGGGGDGERAMLTLVQALRKRAPSVTVVTRPPEAAWHAKAIALLQRDARATVFAHPKLHAKVLALECDGFRAALLGSANFTARADSYNREIAIELRSTRDARNDQISATIFDLVDYARSLSAEDEATLL